MQKGHLLQFDCLDCHKPVQFSVFEIENQKDGITCAHCQKRYIFADPDLTRQIKKFETLCRTLCDSEEILSNTSVGVDVGGRQIKIPYKILLSRLSSHIDLDIGGKKISIQFRIEPTKDVPKERTP